MNPAVRTIALCALALWLPAAALAESGSASASIKLRLVVPPVVRLLDNQHPLNVDLQWPEATQQIEVLTTIRQGFCASLRLTVLGIRNWTVESLGGPVQVNRTVDGYRVCALRHGRHQVRLAHRFDFEDAALTGSLPWPVQTELSAL